MNKINFLSETIDFLGLFNKSPDDVEYVTDGEQCCSWYAFSKIAECIDYDRGYGLQFINDDLKIVGKDWWLERYEYDGMEGWELHTYPVQPEYGKLRFFQNNMA